jgi:hypothetical protein
MDVAKRCLLSYDDPSDPLLIPRLPKHAIYEEGRGRTKMGQYGRTSQG